MADASERLSTDDFARWWHETGERELRQLLYWKWDPIAVSGQFPRTADEYDGYVPEVVSALRKGASATDVAELLEAIESDRMGLGQGPSGRLRMLGSEIVSWLEQSQGSWKDFGPMRR
ncbi:MAG: hypothetical protein ACYC0H_04200 [Solirubrobacteraceae bacterium]